MQNGTKRFNQVEAYICSIRSKAKREYAIRFYHAFLNNIQFHSHTYNKNIVSLNTQFAIESNIKEIMYKIWKVYYEICSAQYISNTVMCNVLMCGLLVSYTNSKIREEIIMVTLQSILREWRNQQLAESRQQQSKIYKLGQLPLNRQNPSISRRLGLRKDQ